MQTEKQEAQPLTARANTYADGGLRSMTSTFSTGQSVSVGNAVPGEYTFTTEGAEQILILEGEVEFVRAGEKIGVATAGNFFFIPAETEFTLIVAEAIRYICLYGKDAGVLEFPDHVRPGVLDIVVAMEMFECVDDGDNEEEVPTGWGGRS